MRPSYPTTTSRVKGGLWKWMVCLQRRLDKLPSKIKHKIADYVAMLQLPRFFRFSPEERVALGPINTNHVEGFFAQMRVTLDGLRNATDTPYVRARLVLLRYF